MLNESAIEKCAECRQTGHTSTACNNGRVGSFDLFGVTINPQADLEDDSNQHDDDDCGSIRKSKNMDIVNLYNNDKYISMDEHGIGKKKGLAWSEHEHKSFLIGLEELGRGHWRSISKNYVPTRTPTQVASHAQKYFIRMNASHEKGKRRSSLFDMPQNESFTVPKAPPTNFDRLPVPSTSENYGVRDYCYTHKGYPNKNETSIDHLLPLSLSLAPMIDFLDQKCCHPLNRKWNSRLITRSRPFVCRHRPMTQGEPKIIEVIDDHE